MQKRFVQKQREAYGAVSHIYTLDQYNENDPASGGLGYLRNVSKHTIQALKSADPDAVWTMQGWLFYRYGVSPFVAVIIADLCAAHKTSGPKSE